jgi:O-acetylhomoserine (thiol)-lyase
MSNPGEARRAVPADRPWGFRTRAVHAGASPDPTTGARAVPIYQTTSFVFEDTADAADLFALQKYGSIYSRIGNPTVNAFEERMASLEGGIGAVATASGQAAEFCTVACLADAGDHIVSSAALYGGTTTQFDVTFRRLGVDTTFVPADEPEAFAKAVTPRTKLLYTEVVANPSGIVADLEQLADIAHANGIPLVVDATTASPHLCRPLSHGADIVLHSATKFIGGHGTSLGGVVVESGRFDWGNGNFAHFTEPVSSYGGLRYWENFGEYAFCTKLRVEQLRDIGACISPFNAFLLLQGLETLPLRMAAHVANAKAVAAFLEAHPAVAWVGYAGLASSPYHELAQRYLPEGPGAVFAFGVKGGRSAGARFIESLELISHLANIGDAKTLVIHPASTTHQQLSDEQLEASGVPADLIRLSVGIEDPEDICWDLDQALSASQR